MPRQAGQIMIAKTRRETRVMAYVFETVPADRGLIDLDDPREVNWWSKQFGCSEVQLRQAVEKVGRSAAKVEQLLDGHEILSV
jgi:hypothetical protein